MVNNFQRPAVIEVSRASAKDVAVGDRAAVRWDPRLLDVLMEGTPPVAAGTHPMSGLPLGVMTEAALLACGRDETGIHILLFANVTYRHPVPRDRPWTAEARVEGLGRRHVRVRTSLHDADQLLCEATLGLARVVGGRAVPELASGLRLGANTDQD